MSRQFLIAGCTCLLSTVGPFAPASVADSALTADNGVPQLVGTPSVRYTHVRAGERGYLSIRAVFRVDRALDRSRYAPIAAPALQAGDAPPDQLFDGVTPSPIGRRSAHCYAADVSQLKRRTSLTTRTWRLGLRRHDRVIGRVKMVVLKPNSDLSWAQTAARRLGC